jgi:hypothetical protein
MKYLIFLLFLLFVSCKDIKQTIVSPQEACYKISKYESSITLWVNNVGCVTYDSYSDKTKLLLNVDGTVPEEKKLTK